MFLGHSFQPKPDPDVLFYSICLNNVTRGRFRPQSEALFAIWKKLKENGIEIPYQQYDVAFKNPLPNSPNF